MNKRRDDLVETALKLFYLHGFHATGIDKILAESGVAKMTLYKHFRSKDELILAALQLRDERFRNWLMSEMEKASANPEERLLAMFDALETWFQGKAFKDLGFSGCAFINAASEFAAHDHPAHRVASEHKRRIVEYLEKTCRDAQLSEPEQLAERLALLKEGAIATAHVRNMPEAAMLARDIARTMIDAARRRAVEGT